MKIDLSGKWLLSSVKHKDITATVPGSVLGALLKNGLIEDPFYRDNEEKARACLYETYTFKRKFSVPKENLAKTNWLFIEGIDTVAKIYVNGHLVAENFDMHLRQRIYLNDGLLNEENEIAVVIASPYEYIEKYQDEGMFLTFAVTEPKAPCMRKAHHMFGWDWGPNLADMGIWRDIYILSTDVGYMEEFRHESTFLEDGKVRVDVTVKYKQTGNGKMTVKLALLEDGTHLEKELSLAENNGCSFILDNPKLWYPRGFGKPTLYNLDFTVCGENGETQQYCNRIGIRKIEIDNSLDEHGLNFCVYVNGVKIFLKGANYIPQDNVLQRVTPERTKRLLELVRDFNHNVIRVWGGGYYPDDDFYDLCDEWGILVWQDLMIACEVFNTDDKVFMDLLQAEIRDNLRRIRHHASIFMFSGDNECEDGVRGHGKIHEEHYKRMSLEILTPLVKEEVSHYFLHSSPTSAEFYILTNDVDNMDTHYWEVGNGEKPYDAYKTIYPRMLSEFGCQSAPLYDTVLKYTREEDLSLDSKVIANHQKRPQGNEKILWYLRDLYGEPKTFKDFVYLSLLSQAEGIKTCVEHLRRNKFRCNGAIYWQLNDCWPGQSWSSIDYYFGLKALHYYSKKFFAPHLISINHDDYAIKINVSNDTAESADYKVLYRYMDFDGNVLHEKRKEITLPPTSCLNAITVPTPFNEEGKNRLIYVYLTDKEDNFLSDNYYQMIKDKHIVYKQPNVKIEKISENSFAVTTDTFTKNIYINVHDNNVVLSDNYFHLLKGQRKVITANTVIPFDSLEIQTLNQIEK